MAIRKTKAQAAAELKQQALNIIATETEAANTVTIEAETVAAEAVAAEPMAPEPMAPEPVAPEPVAPEPVAAEPALLAIEVAQAAKLQAMPAMDAAAVNATEPAISYKIDFSNKKHWQASNDGGLTKRNTEQNAVGGLVIDLALQISTAKGREGYDQRLRLAFQQMDGTLAELNLNATNTNRDGELYVTSPVRSLTGALLAISESEDDMQAFCDGARFRLRPGSGKGVFIEADLAHNGQWIGMASPGNTTRVPRDVDGLHSMLELIKARFRGAGLLLTSKAVIGETPESQMHNTVVIAAE